MSISQLIGQTIVRIDGAGVGSDCIAFVCTSGDEFEMCHYQDCCESVSVEDICGDINDLIGSPILSAEEVTSSDEMPTSDVVELVDRRLTGYKENRGDESYTWTFYKFRTLKGYVDIRWYGSSNGYYSESVDFKQTKRGDRIVR